MFKGRYVSSWSEQSSMRRSMGVLAQGPISSSFNKSDFANAKADLSDCANAQANLSLH